MPCERLACDDLVVEKKKSNCADKASVALCPSTFQSTSRGSIRDFGKLMCQMQVAQRTKGTSPDCWIVNRQSPNTSSLKRFCCLAMKESCLKKKKSFVIDHYLSKAEVSRVLLLFHLIGHRRSRVPNCRT